MKIRVAWAMLAVGVLLSWAAPADDSPPAPDEHADYWVRTLKTHPLKLVRKNAARNLGKLANREAAPALIEALRDADAGVKTEAAKSLGVLGDERAFSALTEAGSEDSDRGVRRAANDAVDRIKAHLEFQKQKELKEQ